MSRALYGAQAGAFSLAFDPHLGHIRCGLFRIPGKPDMRAREAERRKAHPTSAPRKQVYAVCATCCAEARRAPWTGAHASRRSTAVLTTASTVAQLRTALGGAFAPSPASSLRPARSGRRAEPGAARVRGYEPRPRGPHPVPLSRRLMKTPSSGQYVTEYSHNRNFVKSSHKVFVTARLSRPSTSCLILGRERRGCPKQVRA